MCMSMVICIRSPEGSFTFHLVGSRSLSYCLPLFWVLQARPPKSLGKVHVSVAHLAVGMLALQILTTLALHPGIEFMLSGLHSHLPGPKSLSHVFGQLPGSLNDRTSLQRHQYLLYLFLTTELHPVPQDKYFILLRMCMYDVYVVRMCMHTCVCRCRGQRESPGVSVYQSFPSPYSFGTGSLSLELVGSPQCLCFVSIPLLQCGDCIVQFRGSELRSSHLHGEHLYSPLSHLPSGRLALCVLYV